MFCACFMLALCMFFICGLYAARMLALYMLYSCMCMFLIQMGEKSLYPTYMLSSENVEVYCLFAGTKPEVLRPIRQLLNTNTKGDNPPQASHRSLWYETNRTCSTTSSCRGTRLRGTTCAGGCTSSRQTGAGGAVGTRGRPATTSSRTARPGGPRSKSSGKKWGNAAGGNTRELPGWLCCSTTRERPKRFCPSSVKRG